MTISIQVIKKLLSSNIAAVLLVLFAACTTDDNSDNMAMTQSPTGGAGLAIPATGSGGVEGANTEPISTVSGSGGSVEALIDAGLSTDGSAVTSNVTEAAVVDLDATIPTDSALVTDAVSSDSALVTDAVATDSALVADAVSSDSALVADAVADAIAIDASDASDANDVPQPCTGKSGLLRGTSDQTLTAAGLERTFIYHAPVDLDPNAPVPLVIVPHGSTMSGKQMSEITQYAALADREKFVVIFPDGDPSWENAPINADLPIPFELERLAPWNVGEGICPPGDLVAGVLDDQAYMDEMIAFADADQCIDHDHIFMAGFSMGAFFSHENACLRSDIRAVAAHSGGTHDLSACPQGLKPVLIMHFQGDSMIPYDCGLEARDQWVAHNGCSTTASDVRDVLGGTCEYYDDCPANGQVAMCSFTGLDGEVPENLLDSIEAELPAGHAWSGGSIDGENPLAAISVTESATELSWAFFKEFAW